MMAANWKKVRATNPKQALRLCKDYALKVHRLSVAKIAERMGETEDNLYKWLNTGRMPANLIAAYEHACGCSYLSDYLATRKPRVVIDIPRGRKADAGEVSDLQESFADCTKYLARFYAGKATAEETRDAIYDSMTKLAWHHANVEKHLSPELDLFHEDTEVEE